MENCLSFKIKNDISEIATLADSIELFSRKNKIASSSSFEINLVMDEIVSNIIMHGFEDNKEHIIKIKLSLLDSSFSAEIADDGIEFNPLVSTKDDRGVKLEERRIGGLGIHIIKNYMDKVEYKREENKNILVICKQVDIEKQ